MSLPSQPRAVITGGASGLGRTLCLQLAQRSARILIADIHQERADATAGEVRAAGGTAQVFIGDVSDPKQVEAMINTAVQAWGGIDLLVNNAGVAGAGAVGEVSLEDWHWIVGINMWGVIHGCHYAVPIMRSQGSGHILNVASSAGIANLPEMASYNVSKAAVISLSETLHTELMHHGIHVSALCPTFFPTNLLESFRSPDERQRKFAETMFKRATMSCDTVATAALKGVEQNEPHIIPQKDGKLLWAVKRLSPSFYLRKVAKGYRAKVVDKRPSTTPSGTA